MDAADNITILKPDEPLFEESPLVKDPYIWDQCTITIGYNLCPDKTVYVDVRNHDDMPIQKEFTAAEVPLCGLAGNMLAQVYKEQPDEIISVVIALLPKLPDQDERLVTITAFAGLELPRIESITEANLSLPEPINAMLEELKILLPSRGGKRIDGSCTSGMELVIYSPSHWEQPIAAPTKPHWVSKAIQWIADFIKGLRTLVRW